MRKLKKIMIVVSIIAVSIFIFAAYIKYDLAVKEEQAVQIVKEYLAEKYEQEMIYKSVRLAAVDPVYYHVSFVSQNTGIEFRVIIAPSILKSPEEKTNLSYLWDDYLSVFFCTKTEGILLQEITKIWSYDVRMVVTLANSYYQEKYAPSITENMTEIEMKPFYDYKFHITTNRHLNSESKMEEAQHILELFQTVKKLDYRPIQIVVWYQSETAEEGENIKDLITFINGSAFSRAGVLEDWTQIATTEDVIKVMDDQWFTE